MDLEPIFLTIDEIMNIHQRIWWEQTKADHAVLVLLRRSDALPCHQLHYLQMVTEKLGKSYFWRTNRPQRKSHSSFVRFLQGLDQRPTQDLQRIAGILGFGRLLDLEIWIPIVTPLAYALEKLAPSLAGDDGPNPEYPWPRSMPTHAPASHEFAVWTELKESGRGRQLLKVIDIAVERFPEYA